VVVIRSGVRPGDRVVTDGEEKLKDGSMVIPRPAAQVENSGMGNAAVAGGSQQGAGATPLGSQTGSLNGSGSPASGNGQGGQSNQQGTTSGAPRQ